MHDVKYIGGIRLNGQLDQDSYLCDLPAIKCLFQKRELNISSNVTFFVGENGTGKSTLLEAIAVAYGFNAEGGTKNFHFATRETHSKLWEYLTLVRRGYARDGFFLRAESLYNAATYIDQTDVASSYGEQSLHEQSHGESFLSIVQNRFGGKGLYILDEPEAALSPMRLLTFMAEMDALVQDDSQFIIATHSPILMAFPGAEVLEFSAAGIQPVNYRDTEHYQFTRRFLENPEQMLHYLLDKTEM